MTEDGGKPNNRDCRRGLDVETSLEGVAVAPADMPLAFNGSASSGRISAAHGRKDTRYVGLREETQPLSTAILRPAPLRIACSVENRGLPLDESAR